MYIKLNFMCKRSQYSYILTSVYLFEVLLKYSFLEKLQQYQFEPYVKK
jgi:hypothetical protein